MAMKPGHWQKFQKLHIYFLLHGVEIELIFALRVMVSAIRADFKIAIYGHETWSLAKVPEVAHIVLLSFYPRGSKWSLFSLYGPRLVR